MLSEQRLNEKTRIKTPALFNRSSVALAFVTMAFLHGSPGQNKKPDGAQSVPKQVEDTDKIQENIFTQNKLILNQNKQILLVENQILHVMTSNDTPIKVRGGAMTFVAADWFPKRASSTSSQDPFCTSVDNSTIRLKDFYGDPYTDWSQLGLSTNKWTVTLYHSNVDGSVDMDRGVVLEHDPSNVPPDCSADSKPVKVKISLLKPGSDRFYPIPAMASKPTDELPLPSGRHFRRYMDSLCGPDKDLCERIARITIDSQYIKESYDCKELDCTVNLGK